MEFTYEGLVRYGFGFYNPNHAAALMCAMLPFVWLLLFSKPLWQKIVGATLTISLFVALALTYSRTGILIIALEATAFAFYLGITVSKVDGDATVAESANGGKTTFKSIVKNLWAKLTGGTVEATAVGETADISGNGTAVIGTAQNANIHTTVADSFASDASGLRTNGALNTTVAKTADTIINYDTVNGGNIDGLSFKELNIANNVGELNIGTANAVKGNINIADASADVKIGNIENIDVVLSNDADLIDVKNGKISGTARVNGGCDVDIYDANKLVIDTGLHGDVSVRGTVADATLNNIGGKVEINNGGTVVANNVAGNFTVKGNVDNASLTQVSGKVEINNGGTITTTNVDNLKVIEKVGVLNANSDITIDNDGGARIDQINAAGKTLTVAKDGFDMDETKSVVVKAAEIAGVSARDLMDTLYNKSFNLGEESIESKIVSANTLIGSYDNSAKDGRIEAQLGDDVDATIDTKFMKGSYSNGANDTINYTIAENSYIEQTYAKTANEKAIAKVIDSLMTVDNGGVQDQKLVDKKMAFIGNTSMLSAVLPQSVSHAARLNMDLADIMHLDTLYRTSSTRDMLNAYGKELNEHGRTDQLVRGTTIVSVRNMNRFASYGGDANVSGSDDYIYGGLANVEYIVNKDFFAGFGIGGFEAKSEGKDTAGKAETQSLALNLYGDYAFYPDFDWYFGVNYAFGMNEADRQSIDGMNNGKWDSNMIGVFTGVRYAWKPYADREFYIKPTVGVNANFLLNPSFDEKGASDLLKVDSENYTSVKSLVGLEATYALENGLYFAGRMFYTHEFGDNSYDVNAMFMNSGSVVSAFRMKGLEMDRDAGIFGIGAGYNITNAWRVYLDYSAEVSKDVYHNLNAGVQFKF